MLVLLTICVQTVICWASHFVQPTILHHHYTSFALHHIIMTVSAVINQCLSMVKLGSLRFLDAAASAATGGLAAAP